MKEVRTADMGTRIRLETWGEIAGHLGVEVRTAQRWELRIGLPVRRLDGGQAVYAFADEIDARREKSREPRRLHGRPLIATNASTNPAAATGHTQYRSRRGGDVGATATTWGACEYAAASVALIDPANPPAHAPANDVARYRCYDCPDGDPEQYVLLRPSAANALVGLPYNRADGLEVDARGIAVTTAESGIAAVLYRLSADLEPLSARPSDTLWVVMHQNGARRGRTPPPTDARVELWTQKGWTPRMVPYADVPTVAGLPSTHKAQ